LYFLSVGAAQFRDVIKLLSWKVPETESAIDKLTETGQLKQHQALEGRAGEWIVLSSLC
jgi:hypothetical protein